MTINTNRPTITYENIALLKGGAPSYSNLSNSGQSIKLIPLVQDFSFDFNTKTEDILTLGDKFYSKRVNRYDVDVNLNVTILETFEDMFSGFFSGDAVLQDLNKDCSFYTALGKKKYFSDFSDFDETINFGNAFLENFSLSQSTRQFLSSKYVYSCSNINAEIKQGVPGIVSNPAIDLTGLQLQGLNSELPDVQSEFGSQQDLEDKIYPSYKTAISISGVKNQNVFLIDPELIQDFSLNIPFNRKKIFKIGKKYPINRRFVFTSEGSFSLSALTSGFYSSNEESNLRQFIEQNDSYVIGLNFTNGQSDQNNFQISGARLSSHSNSASLSQNLNCSLSFDFNIFDFKRI